MRVYLVIDRAEDIEHGTVFGVFSSREKAEEIMNNLISNFYEFEDSDKYNIVIEEFTLDEAGEVYHWYMNC